MFQIGLCVLSIMPTGIVLFPNPQAINRVDDVVAQATRAYDLGVRQVWREGIASAADLAAVGSGESVRRQLQSYLNAGATDVVLSGLAWAGAAVAEELWAVAASV
jgi:hypothetical protein